MQTFNTNSEDEPKPGRQKIVVDGAENLLPGHCAAVTLTDGRELTLYNVNGEFYATEGYCPHRGAPLAEGYLSGHVIECALHGWQFDVRTGHCLTVTEQLPTYPVIVEAGLIRIEIEGDVRSDD